jgi:WD40 repeat protein
MRRAWLVACVLACCGAADAAAPHLPRVDCFGDPLPRGAFVRMGSRRWTHDDGDGCGGVTFSADGTPISSGKRWVYVWDMKTGKLRRRFAAPRKTSLNVPPQASKDGKVLLVNGTLYDLASGKPLRPAFDYNVFALSEDGCFVAAAAYGENVSICDARSGRVLKRLEANKIGLITALAVSPDGKLVAAGARGADESQEDEVVLWDVGKGKLLRRVWLPGEKVWQVGFSRDSKLLAVASDSPQLLVWDVEKEKVLFLLGDSKARCQGFDFSPDGKVIALKEGEEARYYSTKTGRLEGRITLAPHAVEQIRFSRCGKYLAGAVGQRVAVYDAITGARIGDPDPHDAGIWSLAVSPDGAHVASSDRAGTLVVWDARTGKVRRKLALEGASYSRLAFGDGGRLLACADSRAEGKGPDLIRRWEVETGKELGGRIEARGLSALAFASHDRTLGTLSDKDGLLLWDARTGKRLPKPPQFVPREPRKWEHVAVSHDGKALVAATEGDLDGHGHKFCHVQFWDLSSAGPPRIWKLQANGTSTLAHRECDRTVLVDGDNDADAVRYWDTWRKNQSRAVAWAEGLPTREVVVSLDGKLMAGSGDGTLKADVYVWEAATWRPIAKFSGHEGTAGNRIASVRFSADGRRVFSAGHDQIILGWDLLEVLDSGRPSGRLSPEEAGRQWELLASKDATSAYAALARLARSPQEAVALLGKRLPPAPARDTKRSGKLIADLDDDDFETREAASAGLERLGLAAEPELRRAAGGKPSAEVRHRLVPLLEKLEKLPRPDYPLRHGRAVLLLSWIGDPDARALLARLTGGDPEAPLTRDARLALRTLEAMHPKAPRPKD